MKQYGRSYRGLNWGLSSCDSADQPDCPHQMLAAFHDFVVGCFETDKEEEMLAAFFYKCVSDEDPFWNSPKTRGQIAFLKLARSTHVRGWGIHEIQ